MLTAYGILYDLKYIRFSCTRTKFSFVYLFINLVLVLSQKCDEIRSFPDAINFTKFVEKIFLLQGKTVLHDFLYLVTKK